MDAALSRAGGTGAGHASDGRWLRGREPGFGAGRGRSGRGRRREGEWLGVGKGFSVGGRCGLDVVRWVASGGFVKVLGCWMGGGEIRVVFGRRDLMVV